MRRVGSTTDMNAEGEDGVDIVVICVVGDCGIESECDTNDELRQ